MTDAEYRDVELRTLPDTLEVRLVMENKSHQTWTPENFSLGWQFFDPDTNFFILEGEWAPVPRDVAPGQTVSFEISIPFPPETGGYQIYVSPIQQPEGWAYRRGMPFLRIVAQASNGEVRVLGREISTAGKLRLRRIRNALPKFFSAPLRSILQNRRLIRSMARRDILARYRGSFGDVFWTVLNPLLLMATYFFVFGVVLRARFGADRSSTAFALYFLAGMLPWLAFSEPAGRAPHVILEHRNFVKKLIFPLETLPVNQVVAGLVTELFAAAVFLVALLVIRGSVPMTVIWLPVLLIPQLLFTLGVCWFLAGLGVFVRDLGQIMGFLLTLWFFITPICYPEGSLPANALFILRKNPMYVLVRGYRAILLESHSPELLPLVKLWIVAAVVFFLGHAWFYKLRKSFADVI
ncbi:MAG TPA: ABC transporter permease [Bryobacteraceae bacterium]|jgi:lipopolysaccharide transport system permease protein|nr:ABC transporter permease [Bryobacteraceae bacterium]